MQGKAIFTAYYNQELVNAMSINLCFICSVLVDQISTLVNDTLEKLNASDLLYHHVNNITLPQLLQRCRDIEYYVMQVSKSVCHVNLY